MTSISNPKKLQGKVAFVTGSARRIGRSVALRLADAGADVVLHAMTSMDEIQAVAREVEARGQRSLALLGDVTSEAAVVKIYEQIDQAFGRVDILVNNAAIRGECDFLDMSLEEWRRVNSVILDGAFLCSREALKRMIKNADGGTIVNIGNGQGSGENVVVGDGHVQGIDIAGDNGELSGTVSHSPLGSLCPVRRSSRAWSLNTH